jgi:hypothetical protein
MRMRGLADEAGFQVLFPRFDADVLAVGAHGDESHAVSAENFNMMGRQTVQNLPVRMMKKVVNAVGDETERGVNGIEEWFRAGRLAAVVAHLENVAMLQRTILHKAVFDWALHVPCQHEGPPSILKAEDQRIVVTGRLRGNVIAHGRQREAPCFAETEGFTGVHWTNQHASTARVSE